MRSDRLSINESASGSAAAVGRAFTLVELLVVMAIVGVMAALLLPAIQAAREAARQTVCRNNLKQLGLALQSYHAAHKQLPPGARMHAQSGKKSIGWHVLILPYIEQRPLYDEISPDDQGGALRHSSDRVVSEFFCPSADPPSADTGDLEMANYVGVAGAGEVRKEWPLEEKAFGVVATDGVLYLRSAVGMDDVTDGTSHTLAIGERTVYDTNEPWTLGAVWYAQGGSPEPRSVHVAAAKHVVWPINVLESRRLYYVRDPTAPPELRKVLGNELAFGGGHPGGAFFSLADGSVQFLDDDIDLNVYRALATRAGGESDTPLN